MTDTEFNAFDLLTTAADCDAAILLPFDPAGDVMDARMVLATDADEAAFRRVVRALGIHVQGLRMYANGGRCGRLTECWRGDDVQVLAEFYTAG